MTVQNNVSLPSALERGIDANRSPSDTETTTRPPNDTMDSIQSQTFNALPRGGLHSAAAFRRLLAPPTSNSEIKAIMDCPTSKP
uniref:Uncharacterized protein n=1 Tax=Ciona savignyi TaxID=51511 RepID=H2ZHF7_CIOSA